LSRVEKLVWRIFFLHFISRIFLNIVRALFPLAYKKQTLPLVGWPKKYFSVNYGIFNKNVKIVPGKVGRVTGCSTVLLPTPAFGPVVQFVSGPVQSCTCVQNMHDTFTASDQHTGKYHRVLADFNFWWI
jgi:hypothetical protein